MRDHDPGTPERHQRVAAGGGRSIEGAGIVHDLEPMRRSPFAYGVVGRHHHGDEVAGGDAHGIGPAATELGPYRGGQVFGEAGLAERERADRQDHTGACHRRRRDDTS